MHMYRYLVPLHKIIQKKKKRKKKKEKEKGNKYNKKAQQRSNFN